LEKARRGEVVLLLAERQGESLLAIAEAPMGEAGGEVEPSRTTGEWGEWLKAGEEGQDWWGFGLPRSPSFGRELVRPPAPAPALLTTRGIVFMQFWIIPFSIDGGRGVLSWIVPDGCRSLGSYTRSWASFDEVGVGGWAEIIGWLIERSTTE
jgi:hypothetical protein